jgi:hypothetical protein
MPRAGDAGMRNLPSSPVMYVSYLNTPPPPQGSGFRQSISDGSVATTRTIRSNDAASVGFRRLCASRPLGVRIAVIQPHKATQVSTGSKHTGNLSSKPWVVRSGVRSAGSEIPTAYR